MDEKDFWNWVDDVVKGNALGAPPLETPGMVVSVLPKGSAEQFRPWDNEVPRRIGTEEK